MITRAHIVATMLRGLTVALLAGSVMPGRSDAQRPRSAAVIVAIVDSLPDPKAIALVYRYPDSEKDMIVLRRSDATPIALGGALDLLDHLRQAVPVPSAGRLEVAALQSATPGPGVAGTHRRDRAARILAGLANQPMTAVGKVGLGQQLVIVGTHASP
jgi:hypothetical protein